MIYETEPSKDTVESDSDKSGFMFWCCRIRGRGINNGCARALLIEINSGVSKKMEA